ncbi:MAG: NCS2 family nucleobase:cation symporter [Spirochaetes bacterium]|nr:NCS2 family nucleobase:cation symporter [Spirochaetota bacterium]
MEKNTDDNALIYQLDGRPSLRAAVPIGLQHVLAMFIGNLAPILLISGLVSSVTGMPIVTPQQQMLMIQSCMLASGLATLVQIYPIKLGKTTIQIGAGLPIVMGTSFGFMPTLIPIGLAHGINVILGSVLVASFAGVFMGLFIKYLRKVFPPIVIGSILMAIGLNLLPVGVNNFAGGAGAQNAFIEQQRLLGLGLEVPAHIAASAANFASWQNLLMGGVVFIIIVMLQRFAKGIFKVSAILIGIATGYILAIILGQINFASVAAASVIAPPMPFSIRPEFHLPSILAVVIMVMVSGIETMGHINGMTVAVWNREAKDKELQGGLLADALGNMIASSFNTLPNTSFGQNIGIVSMSKVVNRFCIFIAALTLILAGLSPKVGAVLAIIPPSVLGGAVITVFAMIMLNGIKMIALAGFSDKNIFILAITFGVGFAIGSNSLLVANLPAALRFIFTNPIVAVSFISITLNLLFPTSTEDKAKSEGVAK